MPYRGEVLVAIINNRADFALAMDQHWYRVPVSSQEKWLRDRWPPKWLALYQTKKLGLEAYAIHYFAAVCDIQPAYGWELFPNQSRARTRQRRYHKLLLEPLQSLPKPIESPSSSTDCVYPDDVGKICPTEEINDLYSEARLKSNFGTRSRSDRSGQKDRNG